MKRLLPTVTVLLALAFPAAADAATPFNLPCTAANGVRFCQGDGGGQRVASFDGVPLDADVTLPAAGDGPFPTIVMLHGWGGDKTDFESTKPEGNSSATYHWNNLWFAQRGYMVVNYSARGWGRSCGAPDSRTPDCLQGGWIHLADRRREAHDTQWLLGKLVDQGYAEPDKLAATGISYGGGQSLELAYLYDRVEQPDGSFAPWTSPSGTPMRLAAAWPRWPWSDLVSSLLPNGRFLDFDRSTADKSRSPLGIPIQSFIEGLYGTGQATGFYAPPGVDPTADLTSWHARVLGGEPYDDSTAQAMADEIYGHHQAFGCGGCGTPAPLLIENGWTDDLFPPAEALRVYDTQDDVALQFADLGHQRGSNKAASDRYLNDQGTAFLDQNLKGAPQEVAPRSVTAFTQTCPQAAAPGGPYRAASWPDLHPGAVRFGSAPPQSIQSGGGDPQEGRQADPISGGGDACSPIGDGSSAPGQAVYDGPRSAGFTMMGLPTVQADVEMQGQFGQLDSRLFDVAPDGTRILVSRGAYRLTPDESGKRITFQLHGNGWRFEPGHVPQLELLPQDAPYLRPSNGVFSATVENVVVELPTLERAGPGQVVPPVLGAGRSVRPPAARPRLVVRASPRRVRSGRRRRFTFVVRARSPRDGKLHRVRGARVSFAGRRMRTDAHGRARLVTRLHGHGLRSVRASRSGYRPGRAHVRVTR